MKNELLQSIQYIKNVGPKRAEQFAKIGINTVYDLLFYLPTKHLDRTKIISSKEIIKYTSRGYDGEVTLVGKVLSKENIRYGKKQILKVIIADDDGEFECVWFQGIKFFKNAFNEDDYYAISAKPVITKYGHLQFTHPDFDKLDSDESKDFFNTGKIIPVYRLPKELKAGNIGEQSIRKILYNTVNKFVSNLEETLPDIILNDNSLLSIVETIKNLHFPDSTILLNKALERMKYEEFFYIQIISALKQNYHKTKLKGNSFSFKSKNISKFIDTLPFQLTDGQLKALSDIRSDMESTSPMNRLMQGDVGCGKTIVAIIAMLTASENNFQSAILVPTEILAYQHFKTLQKLLENYNTEIFLLLGSTKKKEREGILEKLKNETKVIVIGTHAVLEEDIVFKNLGLVIIDEQHRFGVHQRYSLIKKGTAPDVIVMTATPIPRTLTMTLYGDLDVSTILSMPKNRKEIKTVVRNESSLDDIYKFIIDKKKEGYQSYIVYPLVEDSDKLELKAAESHYEELSTGALSELNVGLIHGKLNWKDKENIMQEFSDKKFDVLVSTTVIEVGIDIPSANIIIINDAYRFGLSQLHQLRGRVGRSDQQGYCVLITKKELNKRIKIETLDFEYLSRKEIENNKSAIRLSAMADLSDGFSLSEIDMKLRGPGDIFGIKQSGLPELKFADLVNDTDLLIKAKEDAFILINSISAESLDDINLIKNILKQNYKDQTTYLTIA